MIHQNIDFHNVSELQSDRGNGALLRRLPRRVSNALHNGQIVACSAALVELRFVMTQGSRAAVYLTAPDGADVAIYRGEFMFNQLRIEPGRKVRLPIMTPDHAELMDREISGRFSPQVWRVGLDGEVWFHSIELFGGSIRPPRTGETPVVRWLAYGSSITQGYSPATPQQCYVAETARHLKIDVLNLGLSGACQVEEVVAQHISERNDWDFATLEVGVNMRTSVQPIEFDRRVRRMLDVIRTGKDDHPLVLISPFPSAADHLPDSEVAARNTRQYRTILERIGEEYAAQRVHVVDGRELLPHFAGLTCDLVHPSSIGHAEIGVRLADKLRPLCADLPTPRPVEINQKVFHAAV